MAKTQERALISVTTPLGADVLLLTSFKGREELSRLFHYQLDMLSENQSIAATDIVGKAVTWVVQGKDRDPRYFNGVVSRFVAGGLQTRELRHYRAEVVPWLWFLTRTADCRIFQNKTTKQIIEQIFSDLGFSDYEDSSVQAATVREYCVQYRETDFDFISRLMEEEGIFYFFRHENGKHTLVLADQVSAYKDCTENQVDFSGGSHLDGYVTRWEHGYEFRTGKWTQTDYNFETPSTSLSTNTTTVMPLASTKKYEVYDYPGRYMKTADGTKLTKLRMETDEAAYEVAAGASTCATFTLGGKFSLKRHEVDAEAGP
ncbi:MAG TPA: type VI secretion system tip protein TssI/VgrG, partial [Gemmataceae bacterium]|nr:type VI secretion system tip protein TssI/VgrG [Gemmataceae bacterium]